LLFFRLTLKRRHLTLTSAVKRQVRCAHIDTPDFGAYKRPTQEKDSREADYSRRAFTYLLGAGSAVVGAHVAKSVVQDFLDTMSASVRCGARGCSRT
jgi:hypothetical protein